LLLLPLFFGLAGCGVIDGEQARLCRAALPALEPDGAIAVTAIRTDPDARNAIRVDYRVTTESGATRVSVLRCAFGGQRFDPDRLTLVAVETADGELSGARLVILERFWLGDPEALREGEQRLSGVYADDPLIPVIVPASTGYFIQQIVGAMPVSALYAFLAVGYALVYGLVNRINLAFGEVAMVGSFAAVAMIGGFASAAWVAGSPVGIGLTIACAVLAAFFYGALGGSVLGRFVFVPLSRSSHRTFMIATIGLSIALIEAMRIASGSRDRWIQPVLNDPVQLLGGPFQVTITVMQMLEIAGSAVLLAVVLRAMQRSRFGMNWRAMSDDAHMARLIGIDTTRVAQVTFAISSGLAAVAGAVSALHYGQASYGSGAMIGLKAVVAAVLGGLGSLPGAAFGGLIIGTGETLWAAYMPMEWRDTVVLAVLAAVLIVRPQGLLGVERPPGDTSGARWGRLG
jgi:branched-chain amino acid transport system permease protein